MEENTTTPEEGAGLGEDKDQAYSADLHRWDVSHVHLDKNGITQLSELALRAADKSPSIIRDANENPRRFYIENGSGWEPQEVMPNRLDVLCENLTGIRQFADSQGEALRTCYIHRDAIFVVPDGDYPAVAGMPLMGNEAWGIGQASKASPAFRWVASLRLGNPMTPDEFRQTVVILLHGNRSQNAALALAHKVEFHIKEYRQMVTSNSGGSLDSNTTSQATTGGEPVATEFVFSVPVFDLPELADKNHSITCAIEIDAQRGNFSFQPIDGEIEGVISAALMDIAEIVESSVDHTIFGLPLQ